MEALLLVEVREKSNLRLEETWNSPFGECCKRINCLPVITLIEDRKTCELVGGQ